MHRNLLLLYIVITTAAHGAESVDLGRLYPTSLTAGDARPEHARAWEFSEADVFRVGGFKLEVGKELRIEAGAADLGIGHCVDGAVWAVVMPRGESHVTSSAHREPEPTRHVWLRFHPKIIARLFPQDTIFADGNKDLVPEIRAIAGVKMSGSWHAGGKAMIPEPKDMTVDIDTKSDSRRFFVVDIEVGTARYVPAFEGRPVRPAPKITPSLLEASFDQLWESFDREYAMFVLRPGVDWNKLREQYRPRALQAKSAYEFAGVCAEMLRPLRDLHVWMDVAGAPVPVFNRERAANANPSAWPLLLGELTQAGRDIQWTRTPDKIGYVAISQWNDGEIPRQVDEILEQMRDTRGLIVDVRLNGGGSEPLAQQVAGRFLEKEFVYAYSQYRNGPQHTNLTEKIARQAAPRGPWRYPRPVLLLIGQKCMSSSESFVAMMSGAAQVTILGDHTCGSSGNPRIVRLPVGATVSVPRWIDYLPDGTPLDERGFRPGVVFQPEPGAFEGERDDLLSAAVERLRLAPLSDRSIDGPALGPVEADAPSRQPGPSRRSNDYAQVMREEAQDPQRPKVISASPADGAEIDAVTEIRLRFDRPMDPLSLKLDWASGGFLDCEFADYDEGKHEFIIPVRLLPASSHQVVVNEVALSGDVSESRKLFSRDGFQSGDHKLAGSFVWRFQTKADAVHAETAVPGVTSISPPSASRVPLLCFVEIQFDQPMMSPVAAFPHLVAGKSPLEPQPGLIGGVRLDEDQRRFSLALVLPRGKKVAFALTGFRGANGVPSAPIQVEYQAADERFSSSFQEDVKRAGQDPQLNKLLASMSEKRQQLTSVIERIQTLQLNRENGVFKHLRSTSATFKWQRPDRFFADAAGPMLACDAFSIGFDGTNAWWHYEDRKRKTVVVCPAVEMHWKNVSICDSFDLTHRSVRAAIDELGLSYRGVSRRGDQNCHRVEAWTVQNSGDSNGYLTQWWIDELNYRPVELRQYGDGYEFRSRFLYDAVNEPLLPAAFAAPVSSNLKQEPPEALDAAYTNRFLNVRDGADGQMSVRWGKQGPKGTSSGGLN
jgi:hypothetical protein